MSHATTMVADAMRCRQNNGRLTLSWIALAFVRVETAAAVVRLGLQYWVGNCQSTAEGLASPDDTLENGVLSRSVVVRGHSVYGTHLGSTVRCGAVRYGRCRARAIGARRASVESSPMVQLSGDW